MHGSEQPQEDPNPWQSPPFDGLERGSVIYLKFWKTKCPIFGALNSEFLNISLFYKFSLILLDIGLASSYLLTFLLAFHKMTCSCPQGLGQGIHDGLGIICVHEPLAGFHMGFHTGFHKHLKKFPNVWDT